MIRRTSKVETKSARPSMAQTLNRQGSNLSPRTVPDFFPDTIIHLQSARLWPCAVVSALAAISLRPLPPPESDVGFRSKGPAVWRATKEGCDGVLHPVGMEDWGRTRWRAVVERVCALIQSRRHRSEGRNETRRIRSACQQRGEATAVRFATCVDALRVNVVSG